MCIVGLRSQKHLANIFNISCKMPVVRVIVIMVPPSAQCFTYEKLCLKLDEEGPPNFQGNVK